MSDFAEVKGDKIRELQSSEYVEIKRGKKSHNYRVSKLKEIPNDVRVDNDIYVIHNTPTPETTSMEKLTPVKLIQEGDHVNRYKDVEPKTQHDLDGMVRRVVSSYASMINGERIAVLEAGITFKGVEIDTDEASIALINNVITGMARGKPLPNGFKWRASDNTMLSMNMKDFDNLYDLMFTRTNAVFADSWVAKDALAGVAMSATYEAECDAIYSTWNAKYFPIEEI